MNSAYYASLQSPSTTVLPNRMIPSMNFWPLPLPGVWMGRSFIFFHLHILTAILWNKILLLECEIIWAWNSIWNTVQTIWLKWYHTHRTSNLTFLTIVYSIYVGSHLQEIFLYCLSTHIFVSDFSGIFMNFLQYFCAFLWH